MGTETDPAGQDLEVIHHPDERFYELLAGGQFAGLAVYEPAGRRYVFTHTFIAEGYRGSNRLRQPRNLAEERRRWCAGPPCRHPCLGPSELLADAINTTPEGTSDGHS
jgi:hypothetical protein